MTEIASLVLFSGRATQTAAFYRALGVDLEDEDHGDGFVHFATDLDGVHFAVLDADAMSERSLAWREAGSSFPGFYVESLEQALTALTKLGTPLLLAHQIRPWGCRAVVKDPDGRAVEINQREHCAGGADATMAGR
jgi:lactoylglutathione lyase